MYCTWKNTKCRKSKTIILSLRNRPDDWSLIFLLSQTFIRGFVCDISNVFFQNTVTSKQNIWAVQKFNWVERSWLGRCIFLAVLIVLQKRNIHFSFFFSRPPVILFNAFHGCLSWSALLLQKSSTSKNKLFSVLQNVFSIPKSLNGLYSVIFRC